MLPLNFWLETAIVYHYSKEKKWIKWSRENENVPFYRKKRIISKKTKKLDFHIYTLKLVQRNGVREKK